jgi:hypothetical protein
MTTKTSSGIGMPVVIAAAVPLLLVRLGLTFVRMKAKRRGAVRRFRRALLRGGMSPKFAARLVVDYEALGRIRSYLPRGLGIPALPLIR